MDKQVNTISNQSLNTNSSATQGDTVFTKKPFYKNWKVILGVIFVVIIIASFFLSTKNKMIQTERVLTLSINGKSINPKDLSSVYSYYYFFYKNKQKSEASTKNIFLTNYILKDKYFQLGHSQNDLDNTSYSGNNKNTLLVDQLINQNAYLKTVLFSQIGLTWRSGELWGVRIGNLPDSLLATSSAAILASQKLTFYKNLVDQGSNIDSIDQQIVNDNVLNNLNGGQAIIGTFTRITPQDPQIQIKNFQKAVFSVPPHHTSNIIQLEDDNNQTWALGVIYVSDGFDGNTQSINQWINRQINSLKVNSNLLS